MAIAGALSAAVDVAKSVAKSETAREFAKAGAVEVAKSIGQPLLKKAISADEQVPQLSSQAFNDLNKMKKEYGWGVCTLVSIANRTGAEMTLQCQRDFEGHTWKYPLPTTIESGQVGVFLHARKTFGTEGSKAALIYKVKQLNGKDMYVLLAFASSIYPWHNRFVYTDVKVENNWPKEELKTGEHSISTKTDEEKLEVRGTIGQSYSPICRFEIGYPAKLLEEKKREEEKEREEERNREEKRTRKEERNREEERKRKHFLSAFKIVLNCLSFLLLCSILIYIHYIIHMQEKYYCSNWYKNVKS